MKRLWMLNLIALLAASPLFAGVVFEMEVTDHSVSPPRVANIEISAEGRNLKMQVPSVDGPSGELIFRGEKREILLVDHGNKAYIAIDEAALKKLGAAMSQMEQALANVPEGQRAMMEQMMKSRMPAAGKPEPAKMEIESTGDRETKSGYPCVKYDVRRDKSKVGEVWATDWGNIEGAAELGQTFSDMSAFFQTLKDSLASMADKMGNFGAQLDDGTFQHMNELNGFPVSTRTFDGDAVETESTLRSVTPRAIDAAAFAPPGGYKRQEMMMGG